MISSLDLVRGGGIDASDERASLSGVSDVIWLVLLLVLNLGISWWNARVAGLSWIESRMLGGWPRFMTWCVAIQSACGFTMIWAVALGALAMKLDMLPPDAMKFYGSLIYLMLIVPMLGSGLAITIHGWMIWWRDKSMLGLAGNAWNTYATIHNTAQAVQGTGPALKAVGEGLGSLLGGKNDSDGMKAKAIMLAIVLAALAICLGIFMTYAIIRHYEGQVPLPAEAQRALSLAGSTNGCKSMF